MVEDFIEDTNSLIRSIPCHCKLVVKVSKWQNRSLEIPTSTSGGILRASMIVRATASCGKSLIIREVLSMDKLA